jgi:hypothetical protein
MATKRKDFTQIAFAVFQRATGGAVSKAAPNAKQIAGRKGGLIGGKKRMDSMTDDEKAKLSALGVAARKTPASSRAGVRKVAKGSP